jgi:hypothetical protein
VISDDDPLIERFLSGIYLSGLTLSGHRQGEIKQKLALRVALLLALRGWIPLVVFQRVYI